MSEELEVLKEVVIRLNQAEIPYIISGSMAANYYTIPRMTRDMDIVIEMKIGDIQHFISLFEKNYYIDSDMVKNEVVQKGMFNIIHNQYVVKIDFILKKDSQWQESVFLRRKKITIDDISAWIISVEDLIVAKLLWAKDSLSELQLNDVRNLLRTAHPDRQYLNKWMTELGIEGVYQKAML